MTYPGGKQGGLRSATVAGGKLHLVLNNTMAAIEEGRREMLAFLGDPAMDAVACHRLELIFEELVSNTIKYGFSKHSRQSIHIEVAREPGAVVLTFEDDGKPFNPLEAQTPDSFATIETARVGGLGLHLVAKLSADLRYERLTPSSGGDESFAPHNRITVAVAARA